MMKHLFAPKFLAVALLVGGLFFGSLIQAHAAPCGSGLDCRPSRVGGSSSCEVGANTMWCCPSGGVVDTTTNTCILPCARDGRQCGDGSLAGAAKCSVGGGLFLWCCGVNQTIDTERNACVVGGDFGSGPLQNPAEPLTQSSLDDLNPLKFPGTEVSEQDLSTPGGLISRVLLFAFPLAGILLFVMLVWSGFEMVTGAASKKSQDAGKQRATAAVVGFLLLFASYWIVQLLEAVFNVSIL